MSIYTIIQSVVASLSIENTSPPVAPTFREGWKQFQNLVDDEQLTDIVYLDWPIKSDDILVGASVHERFFVRMAFLEKSELEYTPEQHRPIIDRQRRQKNKFLFALSQADLVDEVTDASSSDIINVFNSNKSGVDLQFRIRIAPSEPVC